MEHTVLHVSEAIDLINQTLDYAYPTLVVEGEVSSFKVNQNKFVFFDIKDESSTLGCFMMVHALRTALEDGMRVRVIAQPKLTQWGKFSLTVRDVTPVGEGSLKRAFVLLQSRLEKEGLFAASRKRPLPRMPKRIGVISSTQAAGYADFIKIINQRWGGLEIMVAHVAVQGAGAPSQIVRAMEYFNQCAELPDVIAIVRGGGSLDDLAAFNDEPLVRAIAASRVPVITGIGHEVDTSLADLAADVRAATPSNAAQLLVPDRREILVSIYRDVATVAHRYEGRINEIRRLTTQKLADALQRLEHQVALTTQAIGHLTTLLVQLDPRLVLRRGYVLMRNTEGHITQQVVAGDRVILETATMMIKAEVHHVENKQQ